MNVRRRTLVDGRAGQVRLLGRQLTGQRGRLAKEYREWTIQSVGDVFEDMWLPPPSYLEAPGVATSLTDGLRLARTPKSLVDEMISALNRHDVSRLAEPTMREHLKNTAIGVLLGLEETQERQHQYPRWKTEYAGYAASLAAYLLFHLSRSSLYADASLARHPPTPRDTSIATLTRIMISPAKYDIRWKLFEATGSHSGIKPLSLEGVGAAMGLRKRCPGQNDEVDPQKLLASARSTIRSAFSDYFQPDPLFSDHHRTQPVIVRKFVVREQVAPLVADLVRRSALPFPRAEATDSPDVLHLNRA